MHNHAHSHAGHSSRRDFFKNVTGRILAGASILELAHHRAAWARAMAPHSDAGLFHIEKVTDNVYFARALPQASINSNAAIFVSPTDVLVVDAHSKPSAAASLIAQIKKEVTAKPVRYVVNTHFHWDHTQGDHAYRAAGSQIDFIASDTTKKLMSELAEKRLQVSLENVPAQIDALQARAANSGSAAEKQWCAGQIAQLKAYRDELRNYHLELPTITFGTSYVVKNKSRDLHIEFHGHAHTAGDVVVYSPKDRVVATGDMILGTTPFIADGFPRAWPKTIDSVRKLDLIRAMPGHGPLQRDRQPMTNLRNYLDEIGEAVAAGKGQGKPVADLQKQITVASLKSLQSNGYRDYLMANMDHTQPSLDAPARLQAGIQTNVADVYKNIDRL